MIKNKDFNGTRTILLILFFFSGISGLAYQIIWVKLLAQMFGHTIYAISTVVATFMAGLALGSYLFGKLADRIGNPLKLYALIEAGIGVSAFLILLLNPLFNQIYTSLFQFLGLGFSTFSLSRLVYAFIILIIPTALIGGTFPVISKCYIPRIKNIRKDTGNLYAVNTFGAVSGAILTGFFLLELLGLALTTYLMVIINMLVAVTAWYLRSPDLHVVEHSEKVKGKESFSFLLIIYALCGFVSLALEVLWTRELSIVFLSSTYSFTTVLVTFLIGLTSGSWYFAHKKVQLNNAIHYFYRLTYGIAVMALVSIPLLRYIPEKLYIQAVAERTITWQIEIILNFTVSFAVLIIPTFLMGIAFPLVCTIYTQTIHKIGDHIGRVYAFNTFGSVIGSLAAGFILIPQFGVLNSILMMAALAFVLMLAIAIRYTSVQQRWAEYLVLTVVFGLIIFFIGVKGNGFRPLAEGTTILYQKEDISAEVKVLKDKRGDISLYINEKQQGGTKVSQTERWAGQVPLVFHSRPDSVLLIGLGTGVTLNALAEGPVQHVTCVDLIGSLVEASDLFSDINNDILKNRKKVRFVEADGINYLELVEKNYDMIVCDIVHPDDAGAGALFSVEFYESCRKKLKNDGLFAQWLLLDQLAPKDLSIILATFQNVFPRMQLYFGQEQNQYQKLMLLGYVNKDFFTLDKIAANLRALQFVNELKGGADPFSFLSFFITAGAALENNLASITLNSQNHPVIEYQSPKHRWQPAKSILNLQYLNSLREPVYHYLNLDTAQEKIADTYFRARSSIIKGRLQEFKGNFQRADRLYSNAALLNVDTLLVSELLANIAWKLIEQKKFSLAVTSFKKAIATNHANTAASFSLAELLNNLGQTDEAADFYRYTVRYDPQNFHAFRRLGDLATNQQKFDEAFYYYRQSVEANPRQPVLYYILGQIYYHHKKEYARAVRSFQMSLEQDPFHAYHQQAKNALAELQALIN